MPDSLSELTAQLIAFRDQRDWKQFHSLKSLIAALSVEAGELLELTLWKTDHEVQQLAESADAEALKNECADVFAYLLLVADRAGFDLLEATRHKIILNGEKYPVDKSKGSAKKYNLL